MSKEIYIMPIHISSLVKDPKGFYNQHATSSTWVTYHIVNMDNGDRHIVTPDCFSILKNLLRTTDGNTFHNAAEQKMKDRELTTLRKISLLT